VLANCLLLISLTARVAAHSPDITIYEDGFGVPSIQAASLSDASYALGYVQARDQAQRMATNYKLARGRLAEIDGKSSLLQDTFIRGLGLEKNATSVGARLTPVHKDLVDRFLAGANRSLAEQGDKLPKWIEPFTEVDVIAFTEFVNAAFPLLDLSSKLSPGAGSNQFALGPAKTTTKHPILSMDPHLAWDGQDGGIVWQEFAMYTPDIQFRGVAIPGLPLGVMGHNDRVAWSMTNNNPQLYTIYSVKTNPDNKSQYSYHGQWRDFKSEKFEMRYIENGVLKSNISSARLTDWGPMVPFSNRSVKLSIPDPDNTIEEGIQMLHSRNVADFRTALNQRGLSMWNYVYADTAGNIAYQYNAFVPKLDESFDWNKTVPGEDPKSEWGALWTLDDLPHNENPASGILVNCNSNPKLTTLGNEITGTWPLTVTSYGPTTRWEMLSSLLSKSHRVSPDRAKEIATDCVVPYAAETIEQLSRFADVGNAIKVLKAWDHKAKVDSVGCALYTYWLRDRKQNNGLSEAAGKGKVWSDADGKEANASLTSAAEKMIAEQGTLDVRWGGVQYMQRGTIKTPVQGFGYVAPWSGIAAVSPASAGSQTLKSGQSHATFGSSFRMIVSLEPKGIQSWSVLPYGNSNLPSSPHYADQMSLYAVGQYKPTNFGLSNAKKSSVKSYHLIH
jgi:acyl-homoserine lactone acylase PvdQ